MTPAPLGPSGALKVAMELIDAQAAHIAALEAGRWGQTTRDRVREKRDELEIVTANDVGPTPEVLAEAPHLGMFAQKPCSNPDCPLPYAHNGPCAPADWKPTTEHPTPCHRAQINVTRWGAPPTFIDGPCQHEECPHGFHPTSCGMCTSPAAAYDTGIGRSPATYAGGEVPRIPILHPDGTPKDINQILDDSRAAMEADGARRYKAEQRRPETAWDRRAAGGETVHKGDLIGYSGNTNMQSWADNVNGTPAADYIAAYANLQAAAAAAPEHNRIGRHQEDAWAPEGVCRRCDLLRPLHDAEQEAHARLIRHNHGIPPEGENRP
jgi:hypothetical protein